MNTKASEVKKGTAASPQEKTAADGAMKVAKFKELAKKRVPKAVKALANVAALGNARSYTFDNAQREKVFNAIDAAVMQVKDAFNGKKIVTEEFDI